MTTTQHELFQKRCLACDGTGEYEQDTGGFSPQGFPIVNTLTCLVCHGKGKFLDRPAIIARINGLQDTMNYAAPEVWTHLYAQREVLLSLLAEED